MNDYDWLGNGIYFWENNEERARQFANEGVNIENPAVLGAIIDLGHCMDLTDTKYLEELKEAYDMLYQIRPQVYRCLKTQI